MKPLRFDSIRTVLCLGAHPDDVEIGCGGTMLRLLAEQPGVKVHWVVFSGNGARRNEALASAERLLSASTEREIEVKDFRDSFFPQQGEAIKEFLEEDEQN